MRRREFMAGLGSAAAWPLAGRAQQTGPMRRIGILMGIEESDAVAQSYVAGLKQGLRQLGWVDGRNLRIDARWLNRGVDQLRPLAKALVDLQPDLIVTVTVLAASAAKQQTTSIPILFFGVGDPVDAGLMTSLARPESNMTGFAYYPSSIAGKWLGLLKLAAPGVDRVALISPSNTVALAAVESAAAKIGVTAIRVPVHSSEEIQRTIEEFAAGLNRGLVILPAPLPAANRELIRRLAVQYRLPAIYFRRNDVEEGGLMSYGPDNLDPYLHGGSQYADRILRGEKVGNLPVQFPTKFELVLNRRAATSIGLEFPPTLLAIADDVVE